MFSTVGSRRLVRIGGGDIATGWREGEPILGRSQVATKEDMDRIRQRLPKV
jgi:hypothetical protein